MRLLIFAILVVVASAKLVESPTGQCASDSEEDHVDLMQRIIEVRSFAGKTEAVPSSSGHSFQASGQNIGQKYSLHGLQLAVARHSKNHSLQSRKHVPLGQSAIPKFAKKQLEESCELPSHGKWCRVGMGSTPPFSMAVYKANDNVSTSICDTGTWELSQQDVSDLGTPGHAVDIGANIGFYSLILAANKWTVTSVEPLQTNLALFEASLCANPELKPRITVNKFGLGSKVDHCVIVSDNHNLGDGITKCGKDAENFHHEGYQVRSSYDVRRLDDVLSEQRIKHINFVKFDVEGFECQVMAGAQSLLTKYRPRTIQSEIWPKMEGCLPQDYLGSFAKAHYKVGKDRFCGVQSLTRPEGIVNRYMCRDAENTGALLQFDRPRMVWLQL